VTGRRSNQLSYHPVPERRANVGRGVVKSRAVWAGAQLGAVLLQSLIPRVSAWRSSSPPVTKTTIGRQQTSQS